MSSFADHQKDGTLGALQTSSKPTVLPSTSSAYFPGLQLALSVSEAFHFQKQTAADDAPAASGNVNAVPAERGE